MADARQIPGGLRTQAIVAMFVLLAIGFGFTGTAVENVTTQHVRQAAEEDALAAARGASKAGSEAELAKLLEMSEATGLEVRGDGFVWAVGEPIPDIVGEDHLEATTGFFVARSSRDGVRAAAIMDRSHLLERIERQSNIIWQLLGVEVLAMLAFAYGFFTFFVVRPVRALKVATERAGSGDLASPVTVLPRNEFGDVAASFNEMLVRLQRNQEAREQRVEELAQANEEIQRTQKSLIRSENLASVGQLAAGVAHEIGNPLAALSGYAEIMAEGGLDPEDHEHTLTRMQAQIDRIQKTIRTLLDYSRADDGESERTLISVVAAEAIKLAAVTARARGVEFSDETEELCVLAIPSQLVQVVLNLLLNAADAMKAADVDRPRVVLSTKQEDGTMSLFVDDNGPGVSIEDRARIFDPFFTTKDVGAGTGLGLSISLRIVESFDGTMDVEESPSGGARFVLTFPEMA